MVAQCHKCSALLEGDFGVMHCPQCGEVNFLDEGMASAKTNTKIPVSEPLQEPIMEAPQSDENIQSALSEIIDFGNSSMAEPVGPLVYKLIITGIDTAEMRQAVLENLSDSKLKFNQEDLDTKIRDGVLIFDKLTPIKTSVIVKKLRPLDVQISWSQTTIYEANPSS